MSAEAPETTSFCDTNRERQSGGIKDVELSVEGFYDTAASNIDETYHGLVSGSAIVGFYPTGFGPCTVGREFTGILTSYEGGFATEEAATVSATFSGSPPLVISKSLAYGTISAVGTSNVNSVDFSADNTASQYVVIRLLELTGTAPTFSASFQQSANDSTWTTAWAVEGIAPSNIDAVSASINLVSSGSRYRRVAVALAGTSPCATYFVSTGSKVGNE